MVQHLSQLFRSKRSDLIQCQSEKKQMNKKKKWRNHWRNESMHSIQFLGNAKSITQPQSIPMLKILFALKSWFIGSFAEYF